MEFRVVCIPLPLFTVVELRGKYAERELLHYTMLHGHHL